MKFLTQNNLTAENNSDYSDSLMPAGNTIDLVKKKATLSLFFVWLVTAIICCLLFILNRSTDFDDTSAFNNLNESAGYEGLFHKNTSYQKINTNPNEAFVFVNINRKYIITRYPSHQNPETDVTAKNTTQKSQPVNNSATATKVIRKFNPAAKKIIEDFSIKSTPQ
jgi:hypothetical protein